MVTTQVADLIATGPVPSKYIPQMQYCLIDLSQIADTELEMDSLVAAITYAKNHGKYACRGF